MDERQMKKLCGWLERRMEVLHYAPTPHRFFNGNGGYQILAEVTYVFGWRVRIREIDHEEVPHWHYVQQRTLGLSDWQSKFREQIRQQEAA